MKKRYWLRGVGISLFVPVAFFVNGIIKTGVQDISFGVLFTIEIAIAVGIVGAIIGWLYGKIKNRSLPKV